MHFHSFVIFVIVIFFAIILSFNFNKVQAEYSLVTKIPIPNGQIPQLLAFEHNDRRNLLYVTISSSAGDIEIIDPLTNTIIDTINLGQNSTHFISDMTYNPITQKLYLLHSGSQQGHFFYQISVLDPDTQQIVNTIPLGGPPGNIAINPISGDMYVTSEGANTVYKIDPLHTIVNTISIPMAYGITYNFNKDLVYVTPFEINSNNGRVYVIDPQIASIIKIINVGNLPGVGIAYNFINDKVYVSNSRSSTVSVIDSSTNTLINDIPVGSFPYEILYNTYDGNMYVSNLNSHSISVIDSRTDTIKKTISESLSNPLLVFDMKVDSSTGYIYMSGYDGYVYVYQNIQHSNTCSKENQKHWDKIIFQITSENLTSTTNLPINSELDIKVQDSPVNVIDLKEKVIAFLNLTSTQENRDAIDIIDVDYDIACTSIEPVTESKQNQNNQTKSFLPTEDPTSLTIR
jgi:YVTN family beta-propeller protein